MTPADDQDFEDWYREEHLVDGSKLTGWRKTERYEVYDRLRTEDSPKFLTLVSCLLYQCYSATYQESKLILFSCS